MSKVAFSREHSSIEDVDQYYADSNAALDALYCQDSSNIINLGRFVGYKPDELDDELRLRKDTLDRMCTFETLAAIEARLQIDYLIRCQRKKKDSLSKEFRIIYGRKRHKVSLTDDILFTWKRKFPEHKTRLDKLGKFLDLRNWLAHGRYWEPKKTPHIAEYDYLSANLLAMDIFCNMPLLVAE